MKKILIFLLLVFMIPLVGCEKKVSDASKFKEEYESLNGTASYGDKIVREVNIDSNNPFIYKETSDIVSMIKNRESFVVYFGFASCPWCRSMIENLVKVSKELNIDKIYYVDVLNIRDTYKLDDANHPYKAKDADKSYYELLSELDSVLEDYTLTDSKGKKVSVGEKRIYAPNVVVVEKGIATTMTTGISELQKDAYMTLTDEIKEQSYNMLKSSLGIMRSNTCKEDKC